MTTWNIDPTHSSINFSVRHLVFAKVRGHFTKFSGSLSVDTPSVEATIETASIDTGVGDRDNHLRSADFFDVEKFPQITFKSTKVEKTSDGYKVTGSLTIRDVTKEITLETESGGSAKDPWGNERVAFTAKTSLDRREYGLQWNQALETGGVLVGEKIEIELEIQAVKAKA